MSIQTVSDWPSPGWEWYGLDGGYPPEYQFDGGSSSTAVFAMGLDGGQASTVVFTTTVDGGEA